MIPSILIIEVYICLITGKTKYSSFQNFTSFLSLYFSIQTLKSTYLALEMKIVGFYWGELALLCYHSNQREECCSI